MRVVVIGSKARQGGKEVGEGKEVGSKRGEEGGRRRQGGGGNSGDRCFNDMWGNVLNWDIFMVDDFTRELKLCPIVLSEWGEEAVEFGLSKVDNVGSGVFTKLFKVELGHSTKGFKGRLWGRQGQGSDNIGVGIDRAGHRGWQTKWCRQGRW